MRGLEGRRVLVTGAADGIGRAVVTRLWEEGARPFAADRNATGLAQLRDELPPHPSDKGTVLDTAAFELTDADRLEAAITAAAGGDGHLDGLVLNAAQVTPAAPVHETDEADIDSMDAVNQRSLVRALRWSFPFLRRAQGCVVGVTSMAGVTGQANHALYAASKGWLNALVKATAVDWGPHRIRVNAVAPCGVMTPAMQAWIAAQPEPAAMDANLAAQHLLGRPAEAAEIAAVVAFLCSQDASFVTGAIVPVSGGSECGYKA